MRIRMLESHGMGAYTRLLAKRGLEKSHELKSSTREESPG